MTSHRYHAFGLEIESEMALDAFAPSESDAIDVEITVGDITDWQVGADAEEGRVHFRNWVSRDNNLDIEIPCLARIRVRDGRTVRVQPLEGRSIEEVVAHVQGSGFAALLQQRGVIALHAGSFETDRGAVLIVGASGVGKSTLLNAILSRGFRMMSDDVTPIQIDPSGRPLAISGFPGSRLWRDSAEARGHDVSQLRRVRQDLEKFYVEVPRFREEPLPVLAVIAVYATNGKSDLAMCEPDHRVEVLLQNVYRKNFIRTKELHAAQLRTVSAIATHASIFRLKRGAPSASPDELAEGVVEALGIAPVSSSMCALAEG